MRLSALRREMLAAPGGAIDALLVPQSDPHQSEYLPSNWERRAWVSGFDGSAGDMIVTRDEALLWTDGRYWLQAERQLRRSGARLMRQGAPGVKNPQEWLAALPRGSRVGVDPRTLSVRACRDLEGALGAGGVALVSLAENPVDRAWTDRPDAPASALRAHPLRVAGRSAAEKLASLRESMAKAGADAHPIGALDAIAWLFNLRGADVPCNPVFLAYALVTKDRATLFTNPARVTPAARDALAGAAAIRGYEEYERAMREESGRGRAWWVDEAATSAWSASLIAPPSRVVETGRSPVTGAKAVKNEAELAGMRGAHRRDGAAMCRFLRWLDEKGKSGGVTEVALADRLENFRREQAGYLGPSFPPICGSGPNGAVIHYRATAETDRPIGGHEMLLVDSGGQYEDGTTDVTRTVHLGAPTPEEKDRFTRVLKGHIALARQRFPKGTTGAQLDTLARVALWGAGVDYNHGTGHGVGAALCVHEWPPNVSAKPVAHVALEPGMVFSNEPGFYKEGAFGVRIENLVAVGIDPEPASDPRGFLSLETLTLAPIQTALIERSLLSAAEVEWVNAYHARVRREVGVLLQTEDAAWLERATSAL